MLVNLIPAPRFRRGDVKLNATGEVGVVLTDSNEPILRPRERVIGFRRLTYRVYRPTLFAKRAVVASRSGWVWLTLLRVVLLDDAWRELPGGKRGKTYQEAGFNDVLEVRYRRRSVDLVCAGDAGRFVFEFRPFGSAARLFDWLRKEKAERAARERGTVASPYQARK